MSTNELVPILGLITLGAVLAIAIGQFVSFLSRRRNRQAASKVLSGD